MLIQLLNGEVKEFHETIARALIAGGAAVEYPPKIENAANPSRLR